MVLSAKVCGVGCTCNLDLPQSCYYLDCECPWHTDTVDLDSIPTSLESCRTCGAVLGRYGATQTHMEWHHARGDFS